MHKIMSSSVMMFLWIAIVSVSGQAASEKTGSFPAGVEKICFTRGQDIYVIGPNEKTPQRIIKGSGTDPDLSPKGDAVAFTYNYSDQRKADRTIKIIQLATKQLTEFKSLTDVISYGPQWSPDGSKLAFHTIKDKWQVGALDIATGDWQIIPVNIANDVFLSSWASDTSVLVQDLYNVYEVALDGQIIQQFPIADILAKVAEQGLTSNSRFSLSPDRREILFDSTGGPDADDRIWRFDVATQTLLPVTPKKMNVSEPRWLPSGQEILFASWQGDERFNLTKIARDGTQMVTVLKNALDASYSPY